MIDKSSNLGMLSLIICVAVSPEVAAWDPASECPPLPREAVKAQMLAGELFAAGEESYRAGRPEASLKQFLCSFQIIQHENTVFNIAQIAKLSEGREKYLRLLKEFVAAAQGEIKLEPIREIIAEIDSKNSARNGAAGPESPDGTDDGTAPFSDAATDVDMGSARTETEATHGKGLKVAGWALVGVGVAGLGAGAALQALAGSKAGEAESADTLGSFTAAESSMESFQTGAVVSFAVGGAAAVAGMVCVIVAGRHSERETAISLYPTGNGVLLSGRF